jgi:DNA-binding transcriptional MerR regulator
LDSCLSPKGQEEGYRACGEEDEERLRFVKNARNSGLNLGEIKEVLASHERGEVSCSYVMEAIARGSEEVGRQLPELTRSKIELDRLYGSAKKRPPRNQKSNRYWRVIADAH